MRNMMKRLIFALFLPLFAAVSLSFGASLEEQLCAAIKKNNVQLFLELLDKGADIWKPLPNGKTAGDCSKDTKWIKMAGKHRGRGLAEADIDKLDPLPAPEVPPVDPSIVELCDAAHKGDIGLVRRLIGAGVKVNGQASGGYTALMEAAFRGHVDIVGYLLQHGAAAGIVESNGRTALILTLGRKGAEASHRVALYRCAEMLLKNRADPNQRQDAGLTPLMFVARDGDAEMARLLLKYGADPLARTDRGTTAAAFAQKYGHQEVLDALKSSASP